MATRSFAVGSVFPGVFTERVVNKRQVSFKKTKNIQKCACITWEKSVQ